MTAEHFSATGRRKTSKAQATLVEGAGNITVNGRPLEGYFGRETERMVVKQSLVALDINNQYDIRVNVKGGGSSGQAGAIRLAISRALLKLDKSLRVVMRKAGFLTRDPRSVERKKVGRPKARKGRQFSKR